MSSEKFLILPRWLVPIIPDGAVYEDHALVIDRGRIIDLLPRNFALQQYANLPRVELPNHALMPGLVNLHTHSAMTLLRGIADDLALMDWLQNHIWPAEGRHVAYDYCLDGVRLAAAEMIRGGTTCFNDMYFFPDATIQAALETGMRATVGLLLFDFPSAWGSGPDEYIEKGIALLERLNGQSRVRAAFAPHAPYTVSDGPLTRVRALSDQLSIPIHIHVHETASEVQGGLDAHGMRPWARLKQLGLLNEQLIAVHMTQLSAEEIAEVAHLGVHVAHCPESNLKLGSGVCPIAALMEAGANVGVGTDGTASNNDLDMFAELRLAAMLAKGLSGDPRKVPAAQALRMATLNGARALGIDEEIGSLEIGKAADCIAIDLSAVNTQPVYDVISHLAYAVNSRQVSDVWVAGNALMRSGELLTLNESRVLGQAQNWAERIRQHSCGTG